MSHARISRHSFMAVADAAATSIAVSTALVDSAPEDAGAENNLVVLGVSAQDKGGFATCLRFSDLSETWVAAIHHM